MQSERQALALAPLERLAAPQEIPGKSRQASAIRLATKLSGIHVIVHAGHAPLKLLECLPDAKAGELIHERPADVRGQGLLQINVDQPTGQPRRF